MGKLRGSLAGTLLVLLCACKGSSGGISFDLKPLSPFPGVSEWTMAGGSAAHTGYVPVSLDATKFSARWSVDLPVRSASPCQEVVASGCTYLSPGVTDSADGHVILAVNTVVQSANVNRDDVVLMALDEQDGSAAWQADISVGADPEDRNEISEPTVVAGRVYFVYYVDSQLNPQSPVLDAFDAGTGAKVFSVNPPCASPCNNFAYSADQPLVSGSTVYAVSPISAHDASTGSLLWSSSIGGYAAADAHAIYLSRGVSPATSSPAFVTLDPTSGATLHQVMPSAGELNAPGYSAAAPVLDGTGGAVVGEFGVTNSGGPAPGFLDHYSLAAQVRDWEVAGNFDSSLPVVAKGVIYACVDDGVTAFDLSDGAKLWRWQPADDVTLQTDGSTDHLCSLVLTNNLLFVGSGEATYAVDLASHTVQWDWPEGGKLSISPSGLLYISVNATDTGTAHLVAINLD